MIKRGLVAPKSRATRFVIENFLSGVNSKIDESILPVNVSKNTYNFSFLSGVLKEGFGIKKYDEDTTAIDGTVTNIWVYKRFDAGQDDRLMFSTSKGKIYWSSIYGEDKSLKELKNIAITSVPTAVNYRLYSEDVVLICTSSDNMIVWNGTDEAYKVENSPLVTSMVLHNERMFVTTSGEGSAVWFSDDLDPTNWTVDIDNGGFIELADERGKLNKVISYMNYVYIFRDYGISRLAAFAGQDDFSISNLFVSSGKIYPNSVAVCGDRIVFLAQDGLYCFDGVGTRRIFANLSDFVGKSNSVVCCYHNGNYYLALKMKFADEEKIGCEAAEHANNALLAIDISGNSYSISRGVDIRQLSVVVLSEPTVLAVLADNRYGEVVEGYGKCFDSILPRSWEIGGNDWNSVDKTKVIREVSINTKYDISLELSNEKKKKVIAVPGSETISKIRLNWRGKLIGVKIKSDAERAYIGRIGIHIDKV